MIGSKRPCRWSHPRSARMTNALLAACLCACAKDETSRADDVTFDRALVHAFASGEAADTLPRHLVARQRRLYEILLAEDRAPLRDYVSMGFRWNPTRSAKPTPFASSAEANYYAMLADYAPPALTSVPATFGVRLPAQGTAIVYAELPGRDRGIVMMWRRDENRWKAIEAFDVAYDFRAWQAQIREAERRR